MIQKTLDDPHALSTALAGFVSGLVHEDVPADALRVAELGFADVVGVLVAGSIEPVVQALVRTFADDIGTQGVSLLFSQQRAAPPLAGLVNGAAAHALDYDDAGGHRSAVLVPAILAEAEWLGSSGRDVLTAYVAGYELWSELARRERGQLHERGWHPTSVYGTLAAAACVARLRQLDAQTTRHALGIAASCSSGLVANFGSMVKPFHAGHAAQQGLLAVRLAMNGLTASPAAIDHPRGFLAAVSQHGDFDATSPATVGSAWRISIEGLSVKKYPTCYCTHRAIDSALALRQEDGFALRDVERVRVHIGKTQKAILHADRPQTSLEAKFSIQFAVACALVTGRVGLAEVCEHTLRDPEIRRLMQRVEVELTDEYDALMSQYAPWDQVQLTTTSGRTIVGPRIPRASGHIENPLSQDDLRHKFRACLAHAQSALDGDRLFDALQSLRDQPAGWLRQHIPVQPAAACV